MTVTIKPDYVNITPVKRALLDRACMHANHWNASVKLFSSRLAKIGVYIVLSRKIVKQDIVNNAVGFTV